MPIKASLLKRINICNQFILFAIKNDLVCTHDFGSTYEHQMIFEKIITVSPKRNVVTVRWHEGDPARKCVDTYYPCGVDPYNGEYELRYTINCIIAGIKKEMRYYDLNMSEVA